MDKATSSEAIALAAAAQGLGDKVDHLAVRFDANERQISLLKRQWIALVCLVFIGLAAGIMVATLLYKQTQKVNDYLRDGQRSRETIARINDCLTPGGACYKGQQEQLQEFIISVTDTNHNGKADTQEILEALRALAQK